MYGSLQFHTLELLYLINYCSCFSNTSVYDISFFEYGVHVEGEEISLAMNSFIPPFRPFYTLNVTPLRPDLEKRFTYLRVEYISPLSPVNITFNPEALSLTFYVRFPFINIPFGLVGFSVQVLRSSRVWTTWRRSIEN